MSGLNHRHLQIFNKFVGKFRDATWLKNNGFGPDVYLFRNLESGQVLYTQLPYPQGYNIKKQFQRPNWQNKLPNIRQDIWRPMAVAELPSHDLAVELYDSLVQLRHYRDIVKRDEANKMRKKNEDGNIWYSAQYRPTYSQEAVADLSSVLDAFEEPSTVHWDGLWRKGDDKFWGTHISHTELPAICQKSPVPSLYQLTEEHLAKLSESADEQRRAAEFLNDTAEGAGVQEAKA